MPEVAQRQRRIVDGSAGGSDDVQRLRKRDGDLGCRGNRLKEHLPVGIRRLPSASWQIRDRNARRLSIGISQRLEAFQWRPGGVVNVARPFAHPGQTGDQFRNRPDARRVL